MTHNPILKYRPEEAVFVVPMPHCTAIGEATQRSVNRYYWFWDAHGQDIATGEWRPVRPPMDVLVYVQDTSS